MPGVKTCGVPSRRHPSRGCRVTTTTTRPNKKQCHTPGSATTRGGATTVRGSRGRAAAAAASAVVARVSRGATSVRVCARARARGPGSRGYGGTCGPAQTAAIDRGKIEISERNVLQTPGDSWYEQYRV